MALYRCICILVVASLIGCVDSGSEVIRSTLPSITISNNGAPEGTDILLFVSLSKSIEEPVSFSWTTEAGGSATESVDYLPQSGTATIPAGSLSTSITIETISDADDEVNETIQVRLFNTSNVEIGQNTAIAEIIDDDTPSISVNDSSGPEGSNITFTATLNRVSAKNVTFEWTTSDISTTASLDYTPIIAQSAIIPAGSLTTTVNVSAINDAFDDINNGETFRISIGNLVNATPTDTEGIGIISDSDFPQISVNDITVTENSTATFTISLDIASEQNVSVNWSTANGTALTPADYISATGTATIPAGALSTTVDIITANNFAYEGSENFFINLAAPTNAAILDAQGVATLNDDDPLPTLAIDNLSFVEGSVFSFTVTLTGATELNTQFDWTTSNGSALTPADYTAGSASGVTILAGNTTSTIVVTSLEDVIDEPSQTFNVTLANPVNAALGSAVGIGTILDNDAEPNMTIDDQILVEGGLATFTVSLSTISEANIGFDITTSDVSTTAGNDYLSNSQSLVINAGLLTQSFTVNTIDDGTTCEGPETLNAVISNAPEANVTDALGQLTIIDNDPSLSINDISIAENSGTASFTVTASAICASQNIDVDWATANNTALSPGDYTATSGTATILAGNPNVTLNVPITDDVIAEVTESFFVNLSNPVNAVILDNQGLANITDDDTVPDISITDTTVTEGTAATLNVSLNVAAGSDLTVDYTTVAGTASVGNDFTTTTGTLTFTAGVTSQNIVVPTNNDITEEAIKTFTVQLSNPSLGNIIDNVGLITLNDNDNPPDISINDVAVNEGGNLSFTVSLSNPSESPVSFDWTTVDGTAVNPTHYTSNGAVGETIAAGATTTTLVVATVDNGADGNSRGISVTLSNPTNGAIIDNTGLGTINDNDPLPSLSIDSVSAPEGGGLTFTVTLDAASELDVDFNWVTTDGSATAPTDYITGGATETITAGNTSTTINITGADDAAYEADETFSVTLSAPVNATIGTAVGTGTVQENETAPTLSIDSVSVAEGGSLAFTVSLSFIAATSISVDYATADTTAVAGLDYTAATNTLVIPAGNPTGSINIATSDDNLTEDSETLSLTLSNPLNASIAGAVGTGTLNDNDAIRLTSGLAGAQDVLSFKIANDSSRVIYLADESTPGTFELYSVTPAGTGLVKISGTLTAGGNVTDFFISDDNSKVIFVADANTDEVFELFSVNLDGTSLTNISGALAAGGDVSQFKILADSSQVIFLADKTTDEVFELYAVALTGGAVNKLNSVLVAGGDIMDFAVSADSSKVVFLADRDTDEVFELFVVNDDGTGEGRLNSALVANGDVFDFAIAPNSSLVAFIADKDLDTENELYAVNIAGGVNNQINGPLTAGGNVIDFSWSPDSAKLVYSADETTDEDFELFSANNDGTSQAQINGALALSGDIIDYKISGNSSSVIYLADENTDGINELFSSPIGGGGSTQLHPSLNLGENVSSFAISPDSSKVVYLADQTTTGEFELRSVNTNASANTLISGALVAGGDVSGFTISTDSSKVLFRADKDTDFVNELYSVAIGGGAVTKVSSDLVGGGQIELDFQDNSTSSTVIYRADYSINDVTEILSHSF